MGDYPFSSDGSSLKNSTPNDATDGVSDAVAITPSDSTVIPLTRGLYVGVTGNIKVTLESGATVIFVAAPIGERPWHVTKVWSTSTTATDMYALY